MNSQIKRAAIIGVGLIGGSFGMALKERGLADTVVGVGRNPERLKRAEELGAVDSWSTDLAAGVSDADLVYVSTPVGMELDFIGRIMPHVKPGCVITDAGSTKAEICRGADALARPGVCFVGAHPMAGSEAAGVEAARSDLFVNASYVITPTEQTDADALALVRELAEGIGSSVIVMDPEAHDRCAAVISHLPHLIAAALVSLAQEHSEDDPQVFDLIAGSFRDMTRVASSSPELWRDICLTNADGIRAATDTFVRLLSQGVGLVESKDGDAFEEWFASAKRTRDKIIKPKTGQVEI